MGGEKYSPSKNLKKITKKGGGEKYGFTGKIYTPGEGLTCQSLQSVRPLGLTWALPWPSRRPPRPYCGPDRWPALGREPLGGLPIYPAVGSLDIDNMTKNLS